jgi:alkylation response protein AidB-like acyl-CoA dehydrogenase
MNFDFSDDQRELQSELARFLSEESPLSRCRRALDAGSSDRALMTQLAQLGWLGIAIPEEFGGSGLGVLELVMAAEEIGRVLAPVPFVSSICGTADLILRQGSAEQKARWLPLLASSDAVGTLAFAEKPGPLDATALATRWSGGKVSGVKIAVLDGLAATFVIAACATPDGPRWVIVERDQPGVTSEELRSIDPSRAVCTLRFDNAEGDMMGSDEPLDRALLRLAVFQSFEQVAGADAIFAITREFMGLRHAFGKPIASYQALKHRAADIYTAIELARANAYYAAWALSAESNELAEAACCARLSASQAFELATVEAVQLHGGIGFTWESDCHLFYRRAKWLSASLGSQHEWRRRLVALLDAQVI